MVRLAGDTKIAQHLVKGGRRRGRRRCRRGKWEEEE